MLTTDKTLLVGARAIELRDVIASAVVTGRGGAALELEAAMRGLHELLIATRDRHGSVYVAGNGGSAAVAAHAVTDFLKIGQLRAQTLHEASLATCLANDYGYDVAFARALAVLVRPADVVIAISSSGQSANIRNAAAEARSRGAVVVTLSGFAPDNPLRTLGDFNVWLDSRDYGMVEIGHQFMLHNLSDRIGRLA